MELAKWALAEGCPRERGDGGTTVASAAAQFGHISLVQWLIQEQGFAMDKRVMENAAFSSNLELVRWLRGEGCPWDLWTCSNAVFRGHVEMLRWARANGAPWTTSTSDKAALLGYIDDFGNLEESDDEYGYEDEDSDEYSDDE